MQWLLHMILVHHSLTRTFSFCLIQICNLVTHYQRYSFVDSKRRVKIEEYNENHYQRYSFFDSAVLAEDWQCAVPQCGQPYDREVMENALLQIVRHRERLYHLEDLVCLGCNRVKAAHLAEQCSCAGSYRCKEDVFEFRRKMQIFLSVAIRQKFQLLQECTSWILEVQ